MSGYLKGVIIGKHRYKSSGNPSLTGYFFLLQDKIPAETLSRYRISDAGNFKDNYASEKQHFLAIWRETAPLSQYTSEYLAQHPIKVLFRVSSSTHKDSMLTETFGVIHDFRNVNIDYIAEEKRPF